MRPGKSPRIRPGFLLFLVAAVAIPWLTLVLTGPAVMSAEKTAGGALPPPPAAVDEEGNPWKAILQEEAIQRAHQVPPPVKEVLKETPVQRKIR
ncbi:MAG: hypothetical protein GX422_12740, partial [Deltaproteobacteria bacterium]|nr:hypothetical protein [Deltaproteobacteria bacterium]